MGPGELQEVVGLQDHVVELQERQRLLAIQAQLHRVEGQHAVDREMPAEVSQKLDVVELVEPIGVVGHDRVARAVAEAEELTEDALDARHVGGDLLVALKLAGLVLAGGVADPRGAAAHQHDRLVAEALEPAQHHDRDQIADMKRAGGDVVADVGDRGPLRETRVEALRVRALVQEAAVGDLAQEVRAESGHDHRVRQVAGPG